MKITLDIQNLDNVGTITPLDVDRYTEIFEALIETGGLTGVRNGKTSLLFDGNGIFQRVQLDYYPWTRRNGK